MNPPRSAGSNARQVDRITRRSSGVDAPLPAKPVRILLIGAGRVGTAVAELLRRKGHSVVGVASRSPSTTEPAGLLLGSPGFQLEDEFPEFDIGLIGVPDSALAQVALGLVHAAAPGRVFCHFSGSQGIAPLAPLAEGGSEACAMHPVQAVPSVEAGIARLPGSAWGVTGSPPVVAWARRLVEEDLGGAIVEVSEANRPVWHAASVMTSNGIAALMALGERMLAGIGFEHPEEILGPLASGTVTNAREGGGGAATLTGPLVRGERETVERHLSALHALDPELARSYTAVANQILGEATVAGRLGGQEATLLARLLTPAPRPSGGGAA